MFDVNVVGRDNVLRSLCTVKNLHILNETNKRKANEPIKKSKFNFLLNKPIYEIELNSNILTVPREENLLNSIKIYMHFRSNITQKYIIKNYITIKCITKTKESKNGNRLMYVFASSLI